MGMLIWFNTMGYNNYFVQNLYIAIRPSGVQVRTRIGLVEIQGGTNYISAKLRN